MTMKFIIELGELRNKLLAHQPLNWEVLFKLNFTWIKGKNIYCENMTKKKVYSLMLMISTRLKKEPD